VAETTDAGKLKKGRAEALALARSVRVVHVAKGKKLVTLDLKADQPDDDTLAGLLLGPTGNLRAPTLRKGDVLYVGFSEDAYLALTK
jgi:arsenate reductase-like glutaredoxin family protein